MLNAQKNNSWLCSFFFDRTAVFVLLGIGLWTIASRWETKHGLAFWIMILNGCLHYSLLVIRYPPRRISVSAIRWFVPLLGAHWHWVYVYTSHWPFVSLLPSILTSGVAFLGTLIFLWARLSLGRSFGIVPAERAVVIGGAYRWVRHPLYTSTFLTSFAYLMSHFNLVTGIVWLIGMGLMLLKAYWEEAFLTENVLYQRYLNQVRFRFIPKVV